MRLIEKKCPNCGASLEFDENAKSCKCEYCHRTFEIERDKNITDVLNASNFNLNELKGPLKAFGKTFAGVYITMVIIFIIIFIVILGFIIKGFTDSNGVDGGIFDSGEKTNKKEDLLTDVKDMDGDKTEHLDYDAKFDIAINGEGERNTKHSYSRDGEPKREKLYVAYKKGSNKVIFIYKVVYKDFFHQEDSHTIYIPMVYENINSAVSNAGDAKMDAPTYYFNSDHSCYYYGYSSFDEAYNAVVAPLKDEYKISEK